MNTKQISLILTQNIITSEGKVSKTTRKINQLNPDANNDDLRSFASIIETLTGEKYDQVEVVKTSTINM
ncbi:MULTISPECIES: DUF1659 domain-containing protein [unclassified Staphylococcus]|uniref:sigS mRNA-stabilizing protein SroA n=1 Tax=unclassified Staphylococcus TaxID=91994 RepID=UPI0021D0D482|nr:MULTISPECIES: DUF1659 domain-containing protein [unclassified Staphylococcus]UXR69880.1 DUF1659 domain-containing protein [Staphylococcus sp. IVB6246]UXR71919.1 DUF1659 domain-containing protein [Staphylococcus sp. IVB6240]UXR74227.1 DUF1659 domain-containing protein [Staphylococcus sp. IVB6238]UXR76616.1 DUF1659 domain-containing protein [Staphylococcus sp. IVB6233]UXR80745.1 DUF1659 domain-containing protein [Staphylococcus sp. IVB6218]